MKIILIGFMGAGKSSVAKTLAADIKLPVLEMDDVVLEKTQCQTMQDVFFKGGELLLRETEIAVAKEYSSHNDLVISAGGGIVINRIVLDYLKQNGGLVFFLHADFDVLKKRLEGHVPRPLFQDISQAKALYNFRLPLYQQYADYVINVNDKSIIDIVNTIKEVVYG